MGLVIDYILWLEEKARRQGYGERLVQAAETEARRRGCTRVLLDTMSFQAPGFYQKLGYRVWGELERFVGNHHRYYLWKQLDPGPIA